MVSTPHQFEQGTYRLLGTLVWLGFMINFPTLQVNYLERGGNIFPLCSLKYLLKEMWGVWKSDWTGRELFISITAVTPELSKGVGLF